MKINYVILSSCTDKYYLDFWPIVSKIWKNLLNVTPVLALMTNEDSDFYEDGFGIVKKFKLLDGYSSQLQSQIVRLYLPKLLNGYCLISDIDMAPLQKSYFENPSIGLNEDEFVVYSSDNPECLAENMYPMCYILSHSKNFEIFHNNEEWNIFLDKLSNLNLGWSTDQKYLYDCLKKYDLNKVKLLDRGWYAGGASKRVDRGWWGYNEEQLKNGFYIDSHLLRPYSSHKEEIDKLVSLILTQ
jgi:hypothetical protein